MRILLLLLALVWFSVSNCFAAETDWQCQDGYSYVEDVGDCEANFLFYDPTKKLMDSMTITAPKNPDIEFFGDKQNKIGTLSWDEKGELHFEGKADQSAIIFFNYLIKAYVPGCKDNKGGTK
jgi:hypothetical protein